MVLYRTKFLLSDELSMDSFLELFLSNLSEPFTDLVDYHQEGEYTVSSEDGNCSFSLYRLDHRLGICMQRTESNMLQTLIYMLRTEDGHPVLFVSCIQEWLRAFGKVDLQLFTTAPAFVRTLFWREYGGPDGCLQTDDRPFILRKAQVSIVKQLFSGQLDVMLPVVYVSVTSDTGSYWVDYEALAKRLAGLAHVVVESNPYVAGLIAAETNSMIPSDGAVDVLLPGGESKRFVEFDLEVMMHTIVEYVCTITSSVAVPDAFSFAKLRLDYLLSQMDEDQNLSALCDSILEEKDREVRTLAEELANAKAELAKAEAHVVSLTSALEQSYEPVSVGLCATEKALYDGELKDVVLKILQREFDGMKGSPSLRNTRRYTVLSDLLQQNERTGMDEKIRLLFKENTKNGTFGTEEIRNLERVGFSVKTDTSKHYKIVYQNDDRYMISVSKSPSDHRSGKNLVSTYMNMLFG